MDTTLFIGNKNYSSWSLRPWLVLNWADIPFKEKHIALAQPGYGKGEIAEVLAVAPHGQLPALHVGGLVIWDSLAIAEWAAEQVTSLWPAEAATRAMARSVTCEMHSGFAGLRRDLGMNIRRRCASQEWAEDTARGIARVHAIWTECRGKYAAQGPWLFGKRTIADAFYAPVATRMRTYSVPMTEICQGYVDTVLNDAAFLAWESDCVPNSWDKLGYSVIDGLYR